MWDFEHNTLPASLSSHFTRRNEVHRRNLRDSQKNKLYTASRCKNNYGFKSFLRQGSLLWNSAKDLHFYDLSTSKNSLIFYYFILFINYKYFIFTFDVMFLAQGYNY